MGPRVSIHAGKRWKKTFLKSWLLTLLLACSPPQTVCAQTTGLNSHDQWLKQEIRKIEASLNQAKKSETRARSVLQRSESTLRLAREAGDRAAAEIARKAVARSREATAKSERARAIFEERLERLREALAWNVKAEWYGVGGIARGTAYKVSPEGERSSVLGSPLTPGTMLETGTDGYAEILLPDGAELTLGADSTLTIRELGQAGSVYEVVKGKFHWLIRKVTKMEEEGQAQYLSIHTWEITMAVRGTEFELLVGPEEIGEVTVLEGMLEVTERKSGRRMELVAGQQVSFEPNGEMGEVRSLALRDVERWWEDVPEI